MAESSSSGISSTMWSVLERNPKAAYIYFGGVAASIVIHATLKGASYFARWKEEDKRRSRTPDSHQQEDRTEQAVSSVLAGAGWGFLNGCVRGWIWPVHVIAVGFVLSSKDMRSESSKDMRSDEKKAE